MELLRDFQMRLQRASTRTSAFWISVFALVVGATVARVLVSIVPRTGHDVAAAKALGIVSPTILEGYSKSADSLAYVVAMASALVVSVALWTTWAMWAGREGSTAVPETPPPVPRVKWAELSILTLLAFALFGHLWNGHGATLTSWSVLSEEGEMLAWVDTVLRGGVLSRDTFCLYGPLSIWPIAGLFKLFQPSVGLWRTWIFALNAPALVLIYLLLRGLTRTKTAAVAGIFAIGLVCVGPVPAMSWSVMRAALGLAAFAAFMRAVDRQQTTWYVAAGCLTSAALLYSQEVGIACGVGIAVALLLQPGRRIVGAIWTALGAVIVLLPVVIYLLSVNALGATIDNLFLFPRVRMLGFAAYPFPRFELTIESLLYYFVPAALTVAAFWTGTKLLAGMRDARVLAEIGIYIFGALVFGAAVSRPDELHCAFAAPPAFVLLTALVERVCLALRWRLVRIAAMLVVGALSLTLWRALVVPNARSLVQPPSGHALDLPRAGHALFSEEFARDLKEITLAIQSRTAPDEPIWIYPNEALLYFLADRPQPTRFPLATFAVTRAQREQLIADLERTRPQWAVVYFDAAEHDGIPYPVALPEVAAYFGANYHLYEVFGSFALLRRGL